MTKYLFLALFSSVLSFADEIKIYKDYSYNQNINSIDANLTETKDSLLSSKGIKTYILKDNTVLVTKEKKLIMVKISKSEYDLQEEIDLTISNGFHLDSIKYISRNGAEKVTNVKELIQKVSLERDRSFVFNSFFHAILTFYKGEQKVILSIKETTERDYLDCKICNELEGSETIETKLLQAFFTKKQEKK